MSMCFRVRAPASTSNLGPGFDTLGIAVNLEIVVEVQAEARDGFSIRIEGEGKGVLPETERNWVLKAAREVAGGAVDRARWLISSDIPVARGLGSSAAARAAGIAAGHMLHNRELPRRRELFESIVRTENHPDNAGPTVYGGFRVSGRGISGHWESWAGALKDPDLVRLLLVIPDVPVPTAQARTLLPKTFARRDCVRNIQGVSTLLTGLATGDWKMVQEGCHDHIHEPYRLPLVPGLGDALQILRTHTDCGGAYLSGAGPVLAAFLLPEAKDGQRAGDEAVDVLRAANIQASSRVVTVSSDGLTAEVIDAKNDVTA